MNLGWLRSNFHGKIGHRLLRAPPFLATAPWILFESTNPPRRTCGVVRCGIVVGNDIHFDRSPACIGRILAPGDASYFVQKRKPSFGTCRILATEYGPYVFWKDYPPNSPTMLGLAAPLLHFRPITLLIRPFLPHDRYRLRIGRIAIFSFREFSSESREETLHFGKRRGSHSIAHLSNLHPHAWQGRLCRRASRLILTAF